MTVIIMAPLYLLWISLIFSCAYENIALHKPTWLLHPYNPGYGRFDASNAVDGLRSNLSWNGGQCVLSSNNQRTAIWRVDLEDILSIRHIVIYYRTDNAPWGSTNGYSKRALGFSLYVSNTTEKAQGHLCFQDTNYTTATIPAVLNVTCPVHGRYVIYYNERLPGVTYPSGYSQYAFNELCEVEVYGCPRPGFYGVNCNISCSANCYNIYCNIETGACQGCKLGYKGHRCEQECDNRKYGAGCLEDCGNCVGLEQCHHVNGTCLNGCDPGFKSGTCKVSCPVGFYRMNCLERCNTNCGVPGQCNKTSGECEGGCQPGWRGILCDTKCGGNMYGDNCRQPCGHCRNSEQCHHINGSCFNDCDRGYQGRKCTRECPEDRYGYNCQERCNINCGVSERCDRVTGQCQNGCQSGWKNQKCDSKCDDKTFGLDCNQDCGFCVDNEQCDHVNGTCTNGCERGYEGITCTKAIGQSSYSNTSCQLSPVLYGIAAGFGLSVVLNIYLIVRYVRDKKYKTKTQQSETEDQSPTEFSVTNEAIYDITEDNVDYQSLGELSEQSPYDQLK